MIKIKKIGCLVSAVLLLSVSVCFAQEDVIAKIGDETITHEDVDSSTANIPEPFKKAFEKKTVDNLIDSKVYSILARQQGLDKTPGFAKRLEQEKTKILADYFKAQVIEPLIKPTPEEMKAYYDANPNRFQRNLRIKARQILVKQKDVALEVKKRLESGESFEEVSKSVADPSIRMKQNLGWLEKGKIPKIFEDNLFGLKKGEVSVPVKTQMGFHVIQVMDRKEPGVIPIEEALPAIEKQLRGKKLQEITREYWKKAGVVIVDKAYMDKIESGAAKPKQ